MPDGNLIVHWIDSGRQPEQPPDPRFPAGMDVDASRPGETSCYSELPYPAPRCGQHHVSCSKCGINTLITAAGRPDDPRSVRLSCKVKKVSERVLVKAQNVRDYFVKHHEEHNWMDMRSFFCAKPPYPEMVITYDHDFHDRERNLFHRHVDVLVAEKTPEYFAHYLTEEELPSGWDPKFVNEHREELRRVVRAIAPKSFLEVQIFADLQQWPGRWFVMLDERGAVQTLEEYGYIYIRDPQESALIQAIPDFHGSSGDEVVTQAFGRHAAIALATLQFMNCKNVEVVDNPPTRQMRRAAERAGKKPPVTYKTLVIHPMGKRRAPRESTPTGIEMALHICRGHFKKYEKHEDGSGGLGKAHATGVWWWSPQVRGKAEVGRVVKDYAVEEK